MSVYPTNWNTKKANVTLSWRISYWFYDDNLNQKKKIVIKGMNSYLTLLEKQVSVKALIEDETDEIENKGFNKITQRYSIHEESDMSEHTPLLSALQIAFNNMEAEKFTREDIKSTLKYISLAATALRYENLSIKNVHKKHLVALLNKTGEIKKELVAQQIKQGKKVQHPNPWTPNNFNAYRKNLSILFNTLVEDYEVAEVNLVQGIKKKKTVKKIRETLTDEQRFIVNGYLREYKYTFWRFLQIFFHAGSREVEMLRLLKSDVDLANQRFKVVVKKGTGDYAEEWRPIKTTILSLWKEVLEKAKPNQYLFSEVLEPGDKQIRTEQIARRWNRHVKQRFGVTADFYSLKHTNLDELSQDHGVDVAQLAAGHKSPRTTMLYLVNEDKRRFDQIKESNNSFVKNKVL